jgi:hypothetical protein
MIGHAHGWAGLGVWGRRRGLGLGLERRLGRPDALKPRLLVLDPVGQLVAALVGAVFGVLRRVLPLGPRQPARDLGRQLGWLEASNSLAPLGALIWLVTIGVTVGIAVYLRSPAGWFALGMVTGVTLAVFGLPCIVALSR